MPATYVLIASNTLSSNAASVTFSSIPGTYTDLVLKYSIRADQALNRHTLYIRINGSSSSIYSNILLNGYSTGTSSFSNSNATESQLGQFPAATATSNTFGSGEIYIPSYLVSQNKPFSAFNAMENNSSSDVWINTTAALWRSTDAITSIELKTASGSVNFVTGSSFWLYGIKSS